MPTNSCYPKGISRWGLIVACALLVIAICLSGSSFQVVWWAIRVWDSKSTSICDEYLSVILEYGVCSENGITGASSSDCTSFDSTSQWNAADKTLNQPPNSENADMEAAAQLYINVHDLMVASIFFASVTCGIIAVTFIIASKQKGDILYRGNFQILGAMTALVSIVLCLGAIGVSAGENDLTDADLWAILLCPDASQENGSFANNFYSSPLTGYGIAILAMGFTTAAFAMLLRPGGCCRWATDADEMEQHHCVDKTDVLNPTLSVNATPAQAAVSVTSGRHKYPHDTEIIYASSCTDSNL